MPANNQPDFSSLKACIDDSRDALLDARKGPDDPTDYQVLVARLEAGRSNLPPLYLNKALEPFLAYLREIGEAAFKEALDALDEDEDRESIGAKIMDGAQAILQHAENPKTATNAFQEVVSDLYDGFLSEEDRRGVSAPDVAQSAPLVKWGDAKSFPYTLTSRTTSVVRLQVGIVSLAPSHQRAGLMGWAALGHETAGHEILTADDGLAAELANKVDAALAGHGAVAQYWRRKLAETASDVMGVLNMGPAAAIGLIAYFRGANDADGKGAVLSNIGTNAEGHPTDIMRGYIAAETVRLLNFSNRQSWAQAIENEVDADVIATGGTITMGSSTVDQVEAQEVARIIANTIAKSKLDALDRHSLIDIQDWDDEDEQIAIALGKPLTDGTPADQAVAIGFYAAHVVAAAVTQALCARSNLPAIFQNMKAVLVEMHDKNPSWGPLLVEYPGTLAPEQVFSTRLRDGIRLARQKKKSKKKKRAK